MSPARKARGRDRVGAVRSAGAFCSSLSFDVRLYRYDLEGSRAHAEMLCRCGILTRDEAADVIAALDEIEGEIEDGSFPFDEALEDVHMNVEARLVDKVGEAGEKLHTARSRNDQVALDLHMYVKDEAVEVLRRITAVQGILVERAEEEKRTVMPGYTHLQRAQPILLAYHLMAYFFMLQRDRERMEQVVRAADWMPLGAAALAGTPFPVDRAWTAARLGFGSLYENGMDAVSDRDFAVEFVSACALLMVHLSRMCEDVVLWCSGEFGFARPGAGFEGGSSIMPHKRNPDVAELIRGKAGRVVGDLVGTLTMLKGLPLAYDRDLQEDKEALFDAVDTAKASLDAFACMLGGLEFDRDAMRAAAEEGEWWASDLADYLTARGEPFRRAYATSARIAEFCRRERRPGRSLRLDELRRFSPEFGRDALQCFDVERSVTSRRSAGGTAPERVDEQIAAARSLLERAGEERDGSMMEK